MVGETVTVERLAPDATTCEITDPQGATQTLAFDAQGKASWRPVHYGRHQLRCGDKRVGSGSWQATMLVPLAEGRNLPQNANIVMAVLKGSEAEWKNRGVSMVGWVVGEMRTARIAVTSRPTRCRSSG